MDEFAYEILAIMVLLGIIVLSCAIIMFMIGIAKKHSIWTKLAIASITMYAFFVVTIVGLDMTNKNKYDSIPYLYVEEDCITILNRGNSEMKSFVNYQFSNEGIIVYKCNQKFRSRMEEKIGFTFKVNDTGEVYVAVLENDFDDWAYADIYYVAIDDSGNITVKDVEHISPIDDIDVCKSKLMDVYGFKKKDVDELFLKSDK